MAITVSVMAGAGLLLRSFWINSSVQPGFETTRTLTFSISMPKDASGDMDQQKSQAFHNELRQRLQSISGVDAVGASNFTAPLNPGPGSISSNCAGGSEKFLYTFRRVTPGYFHSLRVPLLTGRDFTQPEMDSQAPVAIVSSQYAQRCWQTKDVVGRTVGSAGSNSSAPVVVVGVVGDVREYSTEQAPIPAVYFAGAQSDMTYFVHSAGGGADLLRSVEQQVHSLNPNLPLYDVSSMEEVVDKNIQSRRTTTILVGLFAAVALLLSAIGIYGVLAYDVALSTRDFGVRIALGASRRRVLAGVLGQALKMILAGLLLGLVGATLLTRLLSTMLYGVTARDPLTFTWVAIVLPAIALVAVLIPAFRATRVDPIVALRYE
jgi:predicted permease